MPGALTLKSSTRFYALDAIRGIAAIAVVLYHYTQHKGADLLHGAWVAVDLFFILSGFVLMHSYSKKIAQGMTFRDFLASRLARLGPMYVVGLMLGITAALVDIFTNPDSPIQFYDLGLASLFNAFLLPYFNEGAWPFGEHVIHSTVFPLNDPSWSLFFELFVNLVFFVYLYRFQKINLALAVSISGVVFIALTLGFHQINPGARGEGFLFGFPRVLFEFFLGVLIYQSFHLYQSPPRWLAIFVAVCVVLGCFSRFGAIGLFNALVLAPLLIGIFAKIEINANLGSFLGDISYPLYVTHFPLYRLLYEWGVMKSATPLVQTCVYTGIALLLAITLVRIDKTLRSALKTPKPAPAEVN